MAERVANINSLGEHGYVPFICLDVHDIQLLGKTKYA